MSTTYITTPVKLGEGAFSKVYKGYDQNTGDAVAIKKPKSKLRDRGKMKGQLQKELEILRKLPCHANIIKILDYKESETNSYIVLELCKGESVHAYMTNDLNNAFGANVEEFHNALLDISSGYQHLREHRLAHRDIKPDNVMISFDNCGSATYKLSDLGCAKHYQAEECAVDDSGAPLKTITGTPGFMDPYLLERYAKTQGIWNLKPGDKGEEYSAEVDMWSIGCTLIFIACNCLAFTAATLDDLVKLYNEKGVGTMMGSNIQGTVVLQESFREIAPVNQRTSLVLSNKYKEIILTCFKPLEERSSEEYFGKIEAIRSKPNNGLCYSLNINEGRGCYDLNCNENSSLGSKKFSLKAVQQFCEALKVKVPVIFTCSEVIEPNIVNITRTNYNVVKSDSSGSHRQSSVVKSQCRAIRSMVEVVLQSNFDIKMLKHLALILVHDSEYSGIENKYINKHTNLVDGMLRQYSDIIEIYRDITKINETSELKSLLTKCLKTETSFSSMLGENRRIIYGKQGETALLHGLCAAIVNRIGDCVTLNNTLLY